MEFLITNNYYVNNLGLIFTQFDICEEWINNHKNKLKLVLKEFEEVLLHPDNIKFSLRLGLSCE